VTQDRCSCCRQPCPPVTLIGSAITAESTIIGLDERSTIIVLCAQCRTHWVRDPDKCNGWKRDRAMRCEAAP
jgi:hypothetical protein